MAERALGPLLRFSIFLMMAVALGGCGSGSAGTGGPFVMTSPPPPQSVYVNALPASTFSSVSVYAPAGVNNPTLIRSISPVGSGYVNPANIAVDSQGYIYATWYFTGDGSCHMVVYPPGASGAAQPLFSSANISQNDCGTLAIDSTDNWYVPTTQNAITVYPPVRSATLPAPLRSFTFTNSNGFITGVAVDAVGNTYVAFQGVSGAPGLVQVFSAGAVGTATPIRTISGSQTMFGSLTAIAVDRAGQLYVSSQNASAGATLSFASGANGNVAPIRSISIFGFQLATDASGNVYLAGPSAGGAWVDIFSPGLATEIGTIPAQRSPSGSGAFGVAIGP